MPIPIPPAVIKVIPWGALFTAVGGGFGYWKRRQAKKAAQIAEDEATWLIEWDSKVTFGTNKLFNFKLTNKTNTDKYRVCVDGANGVDRWDVVHGTKHRPLEKAHPPQAYPPTNGQPVFTVTWYLTQSAKKPRTVKVWGQA
ncbi:hypothetical protein [Mycolicibacterium sp. CBMA 226]|uniref:hypothetical protein n=1 Tax=Mycolicibacterium sp. CBMA 226 TaxID=2606611 RepID=UPI0012DDB7F8|nr:hypothetical protein [Mycolicibacterium sp. CBMA 226]MUL77218.1 hypothetical protein [Mycolicibacterium sp. CBMA 226]